jgi:hypothetical protein
MVLVKVKVTNALCENNHTKTFALSINGENDLRGGRGDNTSSIMLIKPLHAPMSGSITSAVLNL